MALATIGAITAIVGTAASLGSLGYSAAQGAPELPSGASAARNISQAQAAALPLQRQVAALQQQGGKLQSTPSTLTRGELQAAIKELQKRYNEGNRSDGALGAQIATLREIMRQTPTTKGVKPSRDARGGDRLYDQFTVFKDPQGNYLPKSLATADFTGYGTADIEGELARKFSDIELELGQKYGTQFAEEARKAADLANPEGAAARRMQNELIQRELSNPTPINPMSSMLESQIGEQLKAGRGLDPMSKDLLDASIARANEARGDRVSSGDVATSMMTGFEGQGRLNAAQDKAQSFLESGTSPADIAYRREQQNLANLGSFVSGQTPQSQFQNLSGASQGAAPFVRPTPGPAMPGGAGAVGASYANAAGAARVNQAQQPNPWMAGISSLLSTISGTAKAFG